MNELEWMDELKELMTRCPENVKAAAVAFGPEKMFRCSSTINIFEYLGILEMEARMQIGTVMGTLELPKSIERYRIIDKPEEPKP